ncbi:MAG: DinB family protein [Anaerolineae bacterium]|jgi:hypothetical protein|nr:DinB family protein [Anaerolineae bacterium]
MGPLIAELQQQYHCTVEMLEAVLGACTDEVWAKSFPGDVHLKFWREAYHTIFWIHNFLGPKEKIFEMEPFDKDIDPRLFTPPNYTCARAEVLEFALRTHTYVDEVFGSMTLDELCGPDAYGETEFRNVVHRLMYGLRHGQHHIGRLAAYLDQEGIQVDTWRG